MTHRGFRSHLLACLSAAFLVLLPAMPAMADGIVLEVTGQQDSVKVDHQRALIWQRQDALELVIEPVFNWTAGNPGAWIIPFPAQPTAVAPGSPAFLDRLEEMTAPQFVDVCEVPSCCCSWEPCDASMSPGQELGTSDGVTVWSSGTVGDLDYVILSVAEGNLASTWLASNGFQVPAEVVPTLDGLDVAGVYWFAARVSNPATAGESLAPVSFTFPPTVVPFYPMRITLAGMKAGDAIELHLFTVTEGPAPLVPGGVPWTRADIATGYTDYYRYDYEDYCYDQATPAAYLDLARAALAGKDSFLLEAFGPVEDRLAGTDVGDGYDLLRTGHARVARLWGGMMASTAASDVTFVAMEPPEAWYPDPDVYFPSYCNDKGRCYECGNPCGEPPVETVETAGDLPIAPWDVADSVAGGVDTRTGTDIARPVEPADSFEPVRGSDCSGHPGRSPSGSSAVAILFGLGIAWAVRRSRFRPRVITGP